jgi:hypothetical protein
MSADSSVIISTVYRNVNRVARHDAFEVMTPCQHDSQDWLMYVPDTKTETSKIVWSKNYPASSEPKFLSDIDSRGPDVIATLVSQSRMWFESLNETRPGSKSDNYWSLVLRRKEFPAPQLCSRHAKAIHGEWRVFQLQGLHNYRQNNASMTRNQGRT